MLISVSSTAIFVQILLGTFYFTPSCLSCNPGNLFESENYHRKLYTRYKMYGLNSTDNNNSFENSSKLYNDHFKTKNQTINEKVEYTERKYADKKQLVFPIFQSPRNMQENALHRLTRRKRSGFGIGSETDSVTIIPEGLLESNPRGSNSNTRKHASSNSVFSRKLAAPVSNGGSHAISSASTATGHASAKSFAKGPSQASAHITRGDNVSSKAKTSQNVSEVIETSIGSGHVLAASKAGGSDNAFATSILNEKGNNRANVRAVEGNAVATAIYNKKPSNINNATGNPAKSPVQDMSNMEIHLDDPFFKRISADTFSQKEKSLVTKTKVNASKQVIASSESGGSENDFSTLISKGNGSSGAAAGIHDISDYDINKTNDNRPLSSKQDISYTQMNFNNPFLWPAFISSFNQEENHVVNPQSPTTKFDNIEAEMLAKAHDGNTTISTSEGRGHVVAKSESGGSENAFSTSNSQGNGTSRAEATVIEGYAVATGMHEIKADDLSNSNETTPISVGQESDKLSIDFDDLFFRPEFDDTFNREGVHMSTSKSILQSSELETTPLPLNTATFNVHSSTTEFNVEPTKSEFDIVEAETNAIDIENNSVGPSKGGLDLVISESRDSENSFFTSISQGIGSSSTEATVVDMQVIASDINQSKTAYMIDTIDNSALSPVTNFSNAEIDIDDSFFRSGSNDTFIKEKSDLVDQKSTTEYNIRELETQVTDDNNASANTKALDESSTAFSGSQTSSKLVLTASKTDAIEQDVTSISQGNGISNPETTVIEGHAIATAVHQAISTDLTDTTYPSLISDADLKNTESSFDDSFFQQDFVGPLNGKGSDQDMTTSQRAEVETTTLQSAPTSNENDSTTITSGNNGGQVLAASEFAGSEDAFSTSKSETTESSWSETTDVISSDNNTTTIPTDIVFNTEKDFKDPFEITISTTELDSFSLELNSTQGDNLASVSKDGIQVLTASGSQGSENAFSTSLTPGNESSKTEATVVEGRAVSTVILDTTDPVINYTNDNLPSSTLHDLVNTEINLDDPFVRPGFIDTLNREENYLIFQKSIKQQMDLEAKRLQSKHATDGDLFEVTSPKLESDILKGERHGDNELNKELENNTPAFTTAKYGSQVVAVSEGKGSGNAFYTSISQGTGSSQAESTVGERPAIASEINKIIPSDMNDNSPIIPDLSNNEMDFKSDFKDPFFGEENYFVASKTTNLPIDVDSTIRNDLDTDLENNSTVVASSKGAGHVVAKSGSQGRENAVSTSISEGNGSSKAEATAVKGYVEATAITEDIPSDMSSTGDTSQLGLAQYLEYMGIDLNDPYFSSGFNDPVYRDDDFLANPKMTTQPSDIKTISFELELTTESVKFNIETSTAQFDIDETKPHVMDGKNATSMHKATDKNSAVTSNDGGHVLAVSESWGKGNALATSISQGNGSSRAEAKVVEGHALATGIHKMLESDISRTHFNAPASLVHDLNNSEIDFNSPFFRPEFIDPINRNENYIVNFQTTMQPTNIETTLYQSGRNTNYNELEVLSSTTEYDVKRTPFQMSRTISDAQLESFEDQSTTEHQVKRVSFQMGRTIGGGPFQSSDEQTTSRETQAGTTGSKLFPKTTTTSTPAATQPPGTTPNISALTTEFFILPSTTEDEDKLRTLQMGRTMSEGPVRSSEEQTTSQFTQLVTPAPKIIPEPKAVSTPNYTQSPETKPGISSSTTESDMPSTTVYEVKPRAFQMGRTFGGGPIESSEEQSTTKHFQKGITFDEVKIDGSSSDDFQLSSLIKQTVPVICEKTENQSSWTCFLSFTSN